MNILKATQLAMEMRVQDLSSGPDVLMVDTLHQPSLKKIKQVSLVKGESRSASIAAASIIAKIVRDRIMEHYDVGYPTRQHIGKIARSGPCPIQRKSFEHVMSLNLPYACGGG